jgi:hypothetical protein
MESPRLTQNLPETNDVIEWLNDDFYTAHWPQARTERDGTKREREVTNNILQKKIGEAGQKNVTVKRGWDSSRAALHA